MDLLTPPAANDEQQELSARALRACLAAEAALASLRAECSPLQSSLPRLGEAGNRNLELAHRSLQLQIDACESLTLCATAAFKQLCDAYFLPSSRKVSSSQLGHKCHPSKKSCTEDYESKRNWTCQACKGSVHLKSEIDPREEAPNGSGDPLSTLLSMESDEAPGDSRSPIMSNPRSLAKYRSSTSSESSRKPPQKEFAGRSHFSCLPTTEYCGNSDASPSQGLAEGDVKSKLFAQVKESSPGASPSLGFDQSNFLTRTTFYKEGLEGSGPASSVKNLSASGSQSSGSQAASRRNLQSSHSPSQGLAGNREFLPGKVRMLPTFASTTPSPVCNGKTILTDPQSPVHRQDADGNVVSDLAARLSCRAGRPIASLGCGSAEASPHSTKSAQSHKFVDGPCPLPDLAGCTLGNNSSNFCSQRATPQPLGTNQSQECKNGQYHLRTNSRASSSDLHSGFLDAADNFDSDMSQARRHIACQGNHGGGQKGIDSPSQLSTGFVASRGRQLFDQPGTNLNMFSQPGAAGRDNSALPRPISARNEECVHSRGDSAFPQVWPYLTSDAHPNSTRGPSNFATRGFAAAESMRPFTKDVVQENTKAFGSEACTLNDLKNWQVVTRLDAEFPDMSSSAPKAHHNATKAKIEHETDTAEGKPSRKWFQVPCDLKQPQRVHDIVASFVDLDSDYDTDEDGDEDMLTRPTPSNISATEFQQ